MQLSKQSTCSLSVQRSLLWKIRGGESRAAVVKFRIDKAKAAKRAERIVIVFLDKKSEYRDVRYQECFVVVEGLKSNSGKHKKKILRARSGATLILNEVK